jgi:hypothetical protein
MWPDIRLTRVSSYEEPDRKSEEKKMTSPPT